MLMKAKPICPISLDHLDPQRNVYLNEKLETHFKMFVITFAAKYTTNKHLAAWLFNVNNNLISARG